MPELLLELFSEEIPARMQARAASDLERAVNKALLDAGLMPEGVKSFAGPRRLTAIATGLPARQPDRKEEKKGPRVGAPEKAIEGFLKSAGLASLDQCETRQDKKGEYYVAVIEQSGRETTEIIAESMPDIMRGFSWPKSMRWGDGELRWVRPLHRILCVFNDEVVPFSIGGVASGDETEGHRFMAPGVIQLRGFEAYAERLRASKVILDAEERREIIANDAQTLCRAQGLELVEDRGLLNEVAGLAEWPVALMGAFDEKFLALPDEVLTASMRGHQKYFSVKDPKTGRLANRFVCIANIEAPDGGAAMRVGYERVLTARLSDAWYLYNQDLKKTLSEYQERLYELTFFDGAGKDDSVGGKVSRIADLAATVSEELGFTREVSQQAKAAALIAKADLVSGMVYEFPELQGVMGRYYALEQNEKIEIADAIRDHYKPAGQGDDVPTAPVSVAVALADKLDTLIAFWVLGKKPTGSSDPFALRRAALGVIQLLLQQEQNFSLEKIVNQADTLLAMREAGLQGPGPKSYFPDLLAFFHDRLKVYLRDKGHRHDHIDAVLADAEGNLQDDLVLIVRKLEALEAFLKTDDGENLAAAYKRAANILKAEDKKGALPEALAVNPKAFSEPEEKALFAALEKAEATATKAVAEEDFEGAMTALASLRAPLDAFFDKVTVNAEQEDLRTNRLALLQRLIAATAAVADFSKLEG